MALVMGGILADPSKSLPGLFAEGAPFDFEFLHTYPFALPSLINAAIMTVAAALMFLLLEEVRRTRFSIISLVMTNLLFRHQKNE